MLKDDPLMRGVMPGSTYNELWSAGELIPQNERELPAQQGAACS